MEKPLTRRQKEIIREIDQIRKISGQMHHAIQDVESGARLYVLNNIKDSVIRGQVIMQATLIEDFLDSFIAGSLFGSSKDFKSAKVRRFRDGVLEEMTFDKKFKFFKTHGKAGKEIIDCISCIQGCRNKIAHRFSLKSRIQKSSYRGTFDISSIKGFEKFHEDANNVNRYFFKLLWGIDL